ncbi:cytokinin dehydrogenase 3-like protein [Tanacetum coccineum]
MDVNLLKEDDGNIPVWVKLHGVPMTAFSEDGLSAIATKFGTPLMLDSYTTDMCMQLWGRSSYARAMIELRADVKLKDNIVVDMPKLVGEGFYMCMIRVEYEWRPPRCSSCKIFGHCLNECPKKIASDAVKNLNNTRQATRGVPQGDLARQVVSNSNPFDALNSIEYDDYLGTNGGIYKSAEMGSLNVVHGSSSNNPIIDKIDKLERQIIDGKLMFVDDDENPLVHTSNVDNESEVEVVFDETTNLLAPTSSKGGNDRGYVDNSLLEQWNFRENTTAPSSKS